MILQIPTIRFLRIFHSRILNKTILKIAVPSSFGMISQTAVMITDTAMVGSLGVTEQAATGLGGMIFWTLISFLFGGSIGIQIIAARRIGENNRFSAGLILTTGLIFFSIFGAILAITGYIFSPFLITVLTNKAEILELAVPFLQIRFLGIIFYLLNAVFAGFYDATGKTYISMSSSIAIALSNIILNWIMIFGNAGAPALGVKGAALASSIAGLAGFSILIIFIFQKSFRPFFQKDTRRFKSSVLQEILKIGFAPAMEGFFMHLAFLMFYRLAANISTVSVAATNIVVSIMSISFMPGYAFGIAATTLMGQAMGAKKFKLAEFAVKRSVNYASMLMGSLGINFIIFRRQIISFFTEDPDVMNEAVTALIIVSLAQVGDAYQLVMSSALRGAGLVNWVLRINASVSFLIMLPAAYFAGITLGFGTAGLWSSVFIWLICLGLLFNYKFKKGDWKKGVV